MLNSNAFGFIGLIFLMLGTSLALVSLEKSMRSVGHFERGLASNMDMIEIAGLFHLLTDDSDKCARTGLIGLDLSPLFQNPPVPVPASLSLQPQTGAPVAILAGGMDFGAARRIDSVSFTSVAPLGGADYLASFSVKTQVRGAGATTKSPNYNANLRVTLTSSGAILACAGAGVGSNAKAFGGVYSWLGGTGHPFTGTSEFETGSHCVNQNPVTHACSCPTNYLPKPILEINFASESTTNIGGNFGCTARSPIGEYCKLTLTLCM